MEGKSIPIPTWLLYELADDSPLKGLGAGRSIGEKLCDLFGPGQLELGDSLVLPYPEELMPAPKRKLNDKVVTKDGSKGSILKTLDQGESGPVKYVVKLENGKEVTLGEPDLADAPAPAPAKAAAPAPADDGTTPPDGAKAE